MVSSSDAKNQSNKKQTSANDEKNKKENEKGVYSSKVGYSFSLNFIIGVGILGLPLQVYRSGYILAMIVLFIMLAISFFTATYIVDTMARAEGLMTLMENIHRHHHSTNDIENNNNNNGNINTTQSNNDNNNNTSNKTKENDNENENEDEDEEVDQDGLPKTPPLDSRHDIDDILVPYYLKNQFSVNHDDIIFPNYVITQRKIELNEIIGLFLGLVARRIYEVILIIFVIGINWSYTTVFGTALMIIFEIPGISNSCEPDSYSGGCKYVYWIYVGIYSGIVIGITMLNLKEQKYFQVALTLLRFILIFTVIITVILLMYSHFIPQPEGRYKYNEQVHTPHYEHLTMFNPNKIFTFISVAAFASIFHQGIPSIAQPIKDKQNLIKIFLGVNITCFILYSVFSICVILFFGEYVEAPASLNWAHFPGYTLHNKNEWWVKLIAYIVVLFPALDVTSTFPLNAVTLATTLSFTLMPLFKKLDEKEKRAHVRHNNKKQHHVPKCSLHYVLLRLLICIIPLIGGFFIPHFDNVLQVTGTVGLLIAFVFPALIEYKSQKLCHQVMHTNDKQCYQTMYTTWYCHQYVVLSVLFIGVVVFIIALYYAITSAI